MRIGVFLCLFCLLGIPNSTSYADDAITFRHGGETFSLRDGRLQNIQERSRYPTLSGRVVDQANILSANTEAFLTQQLQAHEVATGNQLVVVTLNSLQGRTIEEYGVGLGRHWGIGQAGEDNGVLLIVAPHERWVRIEVGYGLEGVLTDARAHKIIQQAILPRFRQKKNYTLGITRGVDLILKTLDPQKSHRSVEKKPESLKWSVPLIMLIHSLLVIVLAIVLMVRHVLRLDRHLKAGGSFEDENSRHDGKSLADDRDSTLEKILTVASLGRTGGFKGGGGSFGGGGASGSW
jgi:uncharacterized protein